MKTTITIHLGGMNFTLDPDAHKLLERYLTAVRENLDSSDNADEIMEDIEARIAELFNDELNKTHTGIITVQQIERIISIMGTPESYEDGKRSPGDTPLVSGYRRRSAGRSLLRVRLLLWHRRCLGPAVASPCHHFGIRMACSAVHRHVDHRPQGGNPGAKDGDAWQAGNH